MCPTIDQIEQACGFLMLNEYSVFVYCCKKCQTKFDSGINLEAHIILEHQEDEKHFEAVYVNDGSIFENSTLKLTETKSEVQNDDIQNESLEKNLSNHPEIPQIKCVNSSGNKFQLIERDNNHTNTALNKDKIVNNAQQASGNNKRKRNGKTPAVLFYCDMCPSNIINFKCKEKLKQHMKLHIKKKLKKMCMICMNVPLNYEKHMKMKHTIKPYKCDFCDASFKNNCNRVIHMRTHTGERPFLCQSCGKSFKSQDTRHKHNLRMHLKMLPHQCTECNRTFICPSQLQEHKFALHSNARPFVCETCGNCYSTKKYLRKHKQSHGEKKNPCKYCEKKFKTSEARRWHERTVHKAV